jgi:predicted MFS family arabinose efflux permease
VLGLRHLPPDARRVVVGRALRGFVDGIVSVLLAQYLTDLGFSPVEVGAIVTGTLLGSAALTLTFGLRAHRHPLRTMLLVAAAVMAATGLGFAGTTSFWPLLVVAVLGTMNPSAGDVSVFLPTEQALIAGEVPALDRAGAYAIYNIGGILLGAVGALASGGPAVIAEHTDVSLLTAQRGAFVLYAAVGVAIFLAYRNLEPSPVVDEPSAEAPKRALHSSRRTVLELAGLFSLDAAGGGFVVTSLLVLWLQLRFDLPATTTAAVFFAAGLLGACSQLLAPRLARRVGLIRTMVFTHIPANLLLVMAAFAPTSGTAIALLLARALLAQMDVPARQAFVMAVVPADERAAAASVTNVPRSLASATTPLLAGMLLTRSTFGWPLVIAGTLKISYDLLLLALYRDVPEEVGGRRAASARRGSDPVGSHPAPTSSQPTSRPDPVD